MQSDSMKAKLSAGKSQEVAQRGPALRLAGWHKPLPVLAQRQVQSLQEQ